MKVLLLNPAANYLRTLGPFRRFMSPVGPLGLAYIAAMLRRAGVTPEVIDQNVGPISNAEVLERIRAYGPQMVGIACLTASMGCVEEIVRGIRALDPGIRIVMGNIHASYFAEELLRGGMADAIVHGEGEETVVDLARCFAGEGDLSEVAGISYLADGEVRRTPRRPRLEDLDAVPYPAWDLFPLEHYLAAPMLTFTEVAVPILFSRGCPYDCRFCSQNYIFGAMRKRSIAGVCDEIEAIHAAHGVRYFGFVDSIFPVSRGDGFAFARELIRRGMHRRIRWFTETRVDLVDRELLEALRESGLRLIMFGFESGNQEVLDRSGKKQGLESAFTAVRLCRRLKIRTFGLFMLGLPGDTVATCRETVRFACRLDCDVAKFNLVVPYPGSELYEQEKARIGHIRDFDRFSPWYHAAEGEELLYVPPGMTTAELVAMQRYALRRFYLRPRAIGRHIRQGSISLINLLRGARVLLEPRRRIRPAGGEAGGAPPPAGGAPPPAGDAGSRSRFEATTPR